MNSYPPKFNSDFTPEKWWLEGYFLIGRVSDKKQLGWDFFWRMDGRNIMTFSCTTHRQSNSAAKIKHEQLVQGGSNHQLGFRWINTNPWHLPWCLMITSLKTNGHRSRKITPLWKGNSSSIHLHFLVVFQGVYITWVLHEILLGKFSFREISWAMGDLVIYVYNCINLYNTHEIEAFDQLTYIN